MDVLMLIAPQNFRDEEFFQPKEELEKAGAKVVVASRDRQTSRGMLGGAVTPDLTLAEANAGDYDAVVFVGGGGSSVYFNNPIALQLAKDAYAKCRVVAAICIAPSILANAGLLKGKKVTSFPSEQGNLRAKGANYTGEGLTIDGKVITADGPKSAREFGRAIARAIKG
ncbi:MAG: DJ-1/PfpI family protein [Candidatus Altiarchaeota archaeon]|nr:DJ-1/PfpI family protein [Candidatus Altiarchaeota archaeon]